MDGIRQYVFSVTTAAIVCGVISALLKKGPHHSLVKLLCGIFLVFSFLKPISNLTLDKLTEPFLMDLDDGKKASEAGAQLAKEAMSTIIKERTETYILDKARELGISVQVNVTVSEDAVQIPTAVIISGTVSPYEKKQLEEYIRQELGISQEDQIWTG